MSTTATETQKFQLSQDELSQWNENGYIVREGVFTPEENDALRQVAEDIVEGKRIMPLRHIDHNALVRDGQEKQEGIYSMHKIHFPSCWIPEFLDRVRDPRLVDPVADLLGPDVLGINNLFIWKAPKIGLGFPWHQDKWYFGRRFKTATTVGTWTAIDTADEENGCLYVIPGSHKRDIVEHDEIEGSQQNEFKLARNARDEDGVPVEASPGSVIWFHSHLLHKSTDNHSPRFRRSFVSHYLSAQAEWQNPDQVGKGLPIMWVRGQTYPDKVHQVETDVLPVEKE